MDKFHRFKPNCTLPDDVPVGFVNAPNIRTTMQIIWSCFSVILLCTWSILRPNVPPELKPEEAQSTDSIYKKLLSKQQKVYKTLFHLFRRIYWAGVMLIAPEFLTTFTTKKMLGTRKNNAKLKDLARGGIKWDLQQTILADMGGIVIDFSNIEDRDVDKDNSVSEKSPETQPSREIPRPSQQAFISSEDVIISKQAENHAQEKDRLVHQAPMPSQQGIRSSGDIDPEPHCPGDDFITQFKRRQSLWFGGCDIPWKRHEPHVKVAIQVKETLEREAIEKALEEEALEKTLEEEALEKALEKKALKIEAPPYWKIQTIASLSGSLWTLDSMQLAVAVKHKIITGLPDIKTAEIEDRNKSDALVKGLAVIQVVWMVFQLCARVYYHHPFAPLELGTVAFSATAIILYVVEWDKPKDINTPVYIKAATSSVSEDAFRAIVEAAPFPYMQFPFVQYKHYYMPSVAFHETFGDLTAIDAKSFVVAMITVVSFGGIHLLAWNLQFPTPVEGLLWKISAIMTIACPVLYCSSHLPWLGKNPKKATAKERFLIKTVVGFANFFYFFARLYLITESIRSLYYLPRGAYIATWTAEFPHLS